jgi:hypothetical protein
MKILMIGLMALTALILPARVAGSAEADLTVTDVQFSPNPIYIMDWITTTVTIKNVGDADYTNQFLVNVQGTTAPGDFLAAGAVTNITVVGAFAFSTAGTFSLNFGVMTTDKNQLNDFIASNVTVIPDPNKPYVLITSPSGGERLMVGKTYRINTVLNKLPNGASVLLELHYQAAGNCRGGCEEYNDVIGSYAGGDYLWTVPEKYVSSDIIPNGFYIRAVMVGPGIQTTYPPEDYGDQFTIEPMIKIVSPAAGEDLRLGKTYTATWTGREPNLEYYDTYLINVYIGKQVGAIFLDRVNAQAGSFTYTIPRDVPTMYGYRIWFVRPDQTGFTSDDFTVVHDNRKSTR